jgi:hypothetical protein
MDKDKIEERREMVQKLMARGITAKVMAELLGCSKHTIQQDMRILKERLIEAAACVSEAALVSHEEIEILTQLGHDLRADMDSASPKDKARLAQAAAHCYFLAGRLKQRRDP